MTQRRGRKAGGSKPHASHSHTGKGDVAHLKRLLLIP
jgi:hypothetical protein